MVIIKGYCITCVTVCHTALDLLIFCCIYDIEKDRYIWRVVGVTQHSAAHTSAYSELS